MPVRVLAVDDDPAIRKYLERALRPPDYELRAIGLASQAVEAARAFGPDVILLDITLSDGDGRDVCRELKAEARTAPIPVVFLTSRDAESEAVLALKAGGHDFVRKGVGVHELLARVDAAARHARQSAPDRVVHGPLEIDVSDRRVRVAGRAVDLAPKEFELLVLLARRPERVLTRTFVIEFLSEPGSEPLGHTISTHISSLRSKLGKCGGWIETVPKAGYAFRPKA